MTHPTPTTAGSHPKSSSLICPDCGPVTRRDFLKTAVGTAAAMSAASAGLFAFDGALHRASAAAVARPISQPETLVASLFKTLTEVQKKAVAFSFDHPLRS